jgi:hypothetical protein
VGEGLDRKEFANHLVRHTSPRRRPCRGTSWPGRAERTATENTSCELSTLALPTAVSQVMVPVLRDCLQGLDWTGVEDKSAGNSPL